MEVREIGIIVGTILRYTLAGYLGYKFMTWLNKKKVKD